MQLKDHSRVPWSLHFSTPINRGARHLYVLPRVRTRLNLKNHVVLLRVWKRTALVTGSHIDTSAKEFELIGIQVAILILKQFKNSKPPKSFSKIDTPKEVQHSPWRMVVEGNFSGAMSNFGKVNWYEINLNLSLLRWGHYFWTESWGTYQKKTKQEKVCKKCFKISKIKKKRSRDNLKWRI